MRKCQFASLLSITVPSTCRRGLDRYPRDVLQFGLPIPGATEQNMPKKVYTFVVEGRGAFPTDMLRYDRCTPYAQEDVHWMEGTANRSVKMVSDREPTPARWLSFGWSVDLIKKQ